MIHRNSTALGKSSRVLLGHPSGNQFFRQLAIALRNAGALSEACTTIDWRSDRWLAKFLPRAMAAELGRRSFSAELGVRVEQHPTREWLRLAAGRLGLNALTRHEIGPLSVDAVYRDFDRWMARRLEREEGARIVYAYEDAAETTFRAAAKLGWTRVYDLPIAYLETSRRLLDEEAARWPDWEPTLVGTRDSAEKLARKRRELELADIVVCPSRFVADSLPPEVRSTRRVLVAPFGSPPLAGVSPRSARGAGEPLRVLFAGALTQRKGLADLFAAMRLLDRRDVRLVVLGSPVVDLDFYRSVYPDFDYEPPRPHGEVLALMRTCDVFCLPSIVEGRALVVQEAMSCGLPAIVTLNTGTDDVVEEGRSGFVVPIRSPGAIAEKIAWFAGQRDAVPAFGERAQAAAARFTWARYGGTIVRELAAWAASSKGAGGCAISSSPS